MLKNSTLHFIFLLGFLFFSSLLLKAQHLSLKKYTIKDGLPQMQVMDMQQDRLGYLWVFTKNGLARFDGNSFESFDIKHGLPDFQIRDISETPDGYTYFLSDNGIIRYDGLNFTVVLDPQEAGVSRFINQLLTDADGQLYCLAYDSLLNKRVVSFNGTDATLIQTNFFPAGHRLQHILVDSIHGILFLSDKNGIFTQEGVKMAQLNSGSYTAVIKTFEKLYLFNKKDLMFFEDGKLNRLALTRSNQPLKNKPFLARIGPSKDSVIFYGEEAYCALPWDYGWVNGCLTDRDGITWIYGEDGLYKVMSTAFQNFTASREGISKNIWSVLEDTTGRIWFNSLMGSIQIWNGTDLKEIDAFKEIYQGPFYMGSRRISNGDLLLTTSEGVLRYDGKKFYSENYINAQTLYVYESKINNTVLFGTTRELVVDNNGEITHYPEVSNLKYGYASSICIDKDSLYWMTTSKTVLRFDGNSFFTFPDSLVPLKNGMTCDCDSSGRIWLGGKEGLFYHDQETNQILSAFPDDDNPSVHFIKVMNKNQLIIGRIGDFIILDLERWREDPATSFQVFNHHNGFLGQECDQNGILKDANGHYWLNTSEAVIKFNPNLLSLPENPPEVYLTGVSSIASDNRIKNSHQFSPYLKEKSEMLKFNHDNRNLQFNFDIINTSNPENVLIKYRLDNGVWAEQKEHRSIFLHGLENGKHSLEYIVSEKNSFRPETPVKIVRFEIIPAFWQTLYFKIFIVIIISGMTAWLVYFVMQRNQKKKQFEHQRNQDLLKLQLNNMVRQFDPHFMLNTINSIGSLFLINRKELAYNYLVKYSKLLRSVLFEGDVVYKPLEDELEFISQYLDIQKIKMGDRLAYEILIDEKVNKRMPVPKMILQNFVENALKHGLEPKSEGGIITISGQQNNNHLEIKVTDNGVGRKAAATKYKTYGTGKGMEITDKVINLLNQGAKHKIEMEINDIYSNNNEAAGTEVKIRIPISKNEE